VLIYVGKISRDSIKKLVKKHFAVSVTDGGADEIAKILEVEAERISSFAVKNAKKNRRDKVTKRDIKEYVIKGHR
jgi:histone H3/H4